MNMRKVPSERDALVKLPGVGRKTANVVLNTFFESHISQLIHTYLD